LLEGKIDRLSVNHDNFLAWAASKVVNPWVMQDQGSKLTHIGWAITTLIKVQIPSLVSTMSTCQWKELNVVEGNACSYSCLMWKLTSCAMATRVSWTTSWVPMCLLPWVQRKRWIPIRLMGCVHTHRRRHKWRMW
jgi:hypothetical protein